MGKKLGWEWTREKKKDDPKFSNLCQNLHYFSRVTLTNENEVVGLNQQKFILPLF